MAKNSPNMARKTLKVNFKLSELAVCSIVWK